MYKEGDGVFDGVEGCDDGFLLISQPLWNFPFIVCSSGINDSGYVSITSSPETNKSHSQGAKLPVQHLSSRYIIDKPIPENIKNRFLDFKILYTDALWKAVSGKRSKNIGDISMKLRYRGETDTEAQLFIVVQCERRIIKKVKKFFDNADVKETLGSDFRMHFIDSALMRLFSPEAATVSTFPGSIKGTTCGTAIEINLNGFSTRATLGGIIKVEIDERPELYALTAGHPLSRLRKDDSSGYSSDSSVGSSSEASKDSENYGPFRLPESEGVHSSAVYIASEQKFQIGTVMTSSFDSSKPTGNHDWALIKIIPRYWEPNFFYPPSTGSGSEKGKQVLVGIDNSEYQQENHDHKTELRISADTNPLTQPAAVMTYRGIQRGTLSSNHSTLFISPSNGFVETLDFLPASDSSLMLGDSGSWVINEMTGEVYGHVVAVDGLGEAHVMPIHPTLRNIKSQLMATKVDLPSWESMLTLRFFMASESPEQNDTLDEVFHVESVPDPTYNKRKLRNGSMNYDYKEIGSSFDPIPAVESVHSPSGTSKRRMLKKQDEPASVGYGIQPKSSLWSDNIQFDGQTLLFDFEMENALSIALARSREDDSGYYSPIMDSSDHTPVSSYDNTSRRNVFTCPHSKCEFDRSMESLPSVPMSFEKRPDYNKHLKDVHDETPFPCPVDGCERVRARGYTREGDLIRHLASKHQGASQGNSENKW